MTSTWLDRVRGTQVLDVAQRLGLTVWPRRGASGGSMQCPACKAVRRHTKSEDKRGAFGVRREGDGGRCFGCDASGDAIDVVSWVLNGCRYRDADQDQRAAVRAWFDDITGPAPAPILAPTLPPLDFPPPDELRAFFESLVHAEDDPEVAACVRGRGLDPAEFERRKLGAVLRRGARVPIWGRLGDLRWSDTGHRLIVPLVDVHAIARSCVARSVTAHPRKSLAPQNHTRRGLVMANALARHVLATGEVPQGYPRPFRVVITEGEIDFLTAACEEPEATGPMVLGVFTGSWSPELAARIPEGAHVIIATDSDKAGEAYAAQIVESLEGRNVTLLRWRAAA